ncbi:MAG: hypothetical protein E3K36_15175 [Candidatus Brocadia sp.]|nr:hypothetical protein [Candidatus Brocadia sp.]
MKNEKKFTLKMLAGIVTFCLVIGLICIPFALASQMCFKCCGSGVWHTDNKIPCSGKGCNYCIKCNSCGGSGKIPDSAKRCGSCKGLGQVHSGKKACTGAGCSSCAPCKTCDTKGWVGAQ